MVWTAARVAEWERTGIRPPVAVWTAAQTAGFLNAICGHRLYAAYYLIALRGLRRGEAAGLRWLRRGEAAGLRWRDIDLDGATAIIACQLQQYDGRLVLCPPKTARSERAVALDRTTVAVVRAHKAAQEAERATLGKDYHDSGYVFTCLNGDPMAPDRLSRTSQPTPTRRCSPEVAHKAAEDVATLIIQAGVPCARHHPAAPARAARLRWRRPRIWQPRPPGTPGQPPGTRGPGHQQEPAQRKRSGAAAQRAHAVADGKRASGHTTANLCPYRHSDKRKDRGKTPGQHG